MGTLFSIFKIFSFISQFKIKEFWFWNVKKKKNENNKIKKNKNNIIKNKKIKNFSYEGVLTMKILQFQDIFILVTKKPRVVFYNTLNMICEAYHECKKGIKVRFYVTLYQQEEQVIFVSAKRLEDQEIPEKIDSQFFEKFLVK